MAKKKEVKAEVAATPVKTVEQRLEEQALAIASLQAQLKNVSDQLSEVVGTIQRKFPYG